MDADLELDVLLTADPNMLPYFVTEAATGDKISVQFAILGASDIAELHGENWNEAVFRDVWPVHAAEGQALKLVCANQVDTAIQGLVRLGNATFAGNFLRKSLLETAPHNRHDIGTPRYRGVGRVLVARLVVESYRQGAQGRVLVETRREAEGFYRRLGFSGLPYGAKQLKLYQAEARQLLQSVHAVP